MTFVQQWTQKLDDYLKREDNVWTKQLARAESATGISRLYLANSLIIIFVGYMLFGQFAQLLCNLLGFVYPAYASLCALDAQISGDSNSIDQIQRLLRYWVVFALLSVADFFSLYLFRIIPFYWLAKLAFLGWCLAPIPQNGSQLLYFKFIRPVFRQLEPCIDNWFASLVTQLRDVIDDDGDNDDDNSVTTTSTTKKSTKHKQHKK
ncbi:receptor expression-enhancing protein 5-like [Oppia nitens]|uniref:receptor expression-enhancing protein 5-like n=1 Tax=Oppia nitens TaxID=1686743 RepID=UPI0023DCABD8|nr:receptor expression-enhancing protein 5-like [Oppia nitens]